jgi:hypothetical protein
LREGHGRRDPGRGERQGLHERQLCAGHVVEAGQELRAQAGARCERGRAREEVGAVDRAEGGDDPRVLAEGPDDDLRARRCRAAGELVDGQSAVAHVAVRPLEHRRHAAALHHRMLDRADGHAQGQSPLGVRGHARELAGGVDDRPRQLLEEAQLQRGHSVRHALQ